MLIDHYGTLMRTFFKNSGVGLTIEVESLALLEWLKLAKGEDPSNLLVEEDSVVVLSSVNKERSS